MTMLMINLINICDLVRCLLESQYLQLNTRELLILLIIWNFESSLIVTGHHCLKEPDTLDIGIMLQNRKGGISPLSSNKLQFSSVSSLAQSCPTLCNPKNRSTPGLPVHHQLPEFSQTHVHQVGDAIQASQPLSPPSHPTPNPS